MKIHCIRLSPGLDLKKSLSDFVVEKNIPAAAILTCVGSVSMVHLRMAGAKEKLQINRKHEIVSLVGTLAASGVHLHMAVSDEKGHVTGGHLVDGNIINTTAEIVIAEFPGLEFRREHDPATGFEELSIYQAR